MHLVGAYDLAVRFSSAVYLFMVSLGSHLAVHSRGPLNNLAAGNDAKAAGLPRARGRLSIQRSRPSLPVLRSIFRILEVQIFHREPFEPFFFFAVVTARSQNQAGQ